jgi:polynucleotide 5'-hydroxyl-kinase GRC3/NOL9
MASDSRVSGGKERMKAPDIQCPETWPRIFEEIATSPGCVFLLGAPDTGKSTMAHFLCSQSIQQGLRTAYIDGDLGQSVCTPPTTVGMVLPSHSHLPMEPGGWDCLYFIGATSPANHLLPTAVGVERLRREAMAQGAQMVVVDTTGLVAGTVGFELKFSKIELLRPRHLVAIQRNKEVEHILKAVQGRRDITVHRLTPSPAVRTRTPQQRRLYRQQRFEAYFSGSSSRTITLDRVHLICPGLPLGRPEEIGERLKDTILGLNDEEYFTRGLGIWEGFDPKRNEVSVTTTLDDMGAIRYLLLGHVTLHITP